MNTQHLVGLNVVSLDAGERLGNVSDLAFAADGRAIEALEVSGGGGVLAVEPSQVRWLAADRVHAIGPDALTIAGGADLLEAAPREEAVRFGELLKRKVVTKGGTHVGEVASVEFDEHGLAVLSFEVSPGFFKSNRQVPADQLVTIGQEVVIVTDAVCAEEPAATEGTDASPTARIVGESAPPPATPRSDGTDGA